MVPTLQSTVRSTTNKYISFAVSNTSTATGFQPLVEAGYKSVAAQGKFVFIGASIDANYNLNVSISAHMMNGTQLLGCCEGDSLPEEVRKA